MKIKSFELFKALRFLSGTQRLRFSKKHQNDLIGPPNPISNLRPIKFAVGENETELERLLRKRREELQEWNEVFWTKHNTNFIKEKEEFVKNELKKRKCSEDTLTADEMSVFYKNFLDKNWKNHFQYNANWHKKNFEVTLLDLCVQIQRLFKKFR